MQATRAGDGWLSGSQGAGDRWPHRRSWLIVAARSAGDPGDRDGLTLFLVDAEGERRLPSSAQRCSMYHNAARLEFDNVEVASRQRARRTGSTAPRCWRACSISAACAVASELLGVAEGVFARTVAYLKERKQFGRLIGEFQALQHRAAHLYCRDRKSPAPRY
ncbi:MAG: hypothetical protein MZV49_20460 [Rhodopseudomonas palustris]|nr:hypothetical protein [Rhodopseudomonas palustris]